MRSIVIHKESHNLGGMKKPNINSSGVCKDLLRQLEQFFNIPQSDRKAVQSEWLTVDDMQQNSKSQKVLFISLFETANLMLLMLLKTTVKLPRRVISELKNIALTIILIQKK